MSRATESLVDAYRDAPKAPETIQAISREHLQGFDWNRESARVLRAIRDVVRARSARGRLIGRRSPLVGRRLSTQFRCVCFFSDSRCPSSVGSSGLSERTRPISRSLLTT